MQSLLSAAAGQLNTQVWVAVAHGPPGHADDLPTLRVAEVADANPISLAAMTSSIMPLTR